MQHANLKNVVPRKTRLKLNFFSISTVAMNKIFAHLKRQIYSKIVLKLCITNPTNCIILVNRIATQWEKTVQKVRTLQIYTEQVVYS